MKFTKYILFLLVTIFAVSCTIEDPTKGNGRFQIVSRIVPFDEHDVQTRAVAEDALNSLDYFIFADISTTATPIWACVFYKHAENDIIAIDRSIDFAALRGVEGDANADPNLSTLAKCRIVLVANYPGIQSQLATDAGQSDLLTYINDEVLYTSKGDTEYKTIDYFQSITTPVEPLVGVPETGLPRVGEYGTIVNLSDGGGDAIQAGTTYTVNLKSLYAKMVFDINVDPTQGNVITGKDEEKNDVYADGNKFLFEGYDVYNLPTTVDMIPGNESGSGLANGTNDSTLVNKIEDANPAAVRVYNKVIEGDLTGSTTAPRKTVFTCYLPERYLTAKVAANEYNYPFAPNGADAARDEDKKLLQRYKPEIAQPNATFVRFYGTFYNHQGHSFNVSYDIYVGNDNYGNFDVVRNRQYNNIITIRGIDNSSDQSYNPNAVSIDHRVNVTRQSPIIVNFRRETLLDAHFEVRPLRIILNKNHAGDKPTNVTVEVLNVDGTSTNIPNWIRLERSYGDGSKPELYCDGNGELGKSSAGKRKYFTYGLVSGLQADGTTAESNNISANTSVTIPLLELNTSSTDPNPNGCVWIYADECLEYTTSGNTDNVRSALIRVTCGSEVINYVVNQHKLFRIGYTSEDGETHYYYIEQEEEYLYNFDADDNFTQNQTFDEGMMWGLNGAQLSFDHTAAYFETWIDGLINALAAKVSPFYDFYLTRDLPHISEENLNKRDRAGYSFTNEIINDVNNSTRHPNTPFAIGELSLDEKPRSAIEYCYNRNKRKANGVVENVNWYMPSIDELEEIMKTAYSDFLAFQDKFYWSSQPAYYQNWGHYDSKTVLADYDGTYYIDDTSRARATKVSYTSGTYANPVNSGVDGYLHLTHIIAGVESLWDNDQVQAETFDVPKTYTYKLSYLFGSKTETKTVTETPNWDNHPGNKLRTAKCRVRAVRKMPTTTTN